jgi:hypothetical protein
MLAIGRGAAAAFAAVLVAALGCGAGTADPTGGGSCATACKSDADCACGTDRTTGACAVGRTECIDVAHQCPDFCGGIDGRSRIACVAGACVKTRTP